MSFPQILVLTVFGVLVPGYLFLRGVRALRLARHLSATATRPVRDGRVALRGRLCARGEPLRTPFTDRAAVSYRWFIGHKTLNADATMSGYRVEAQGFVQTQTVLRTESGDVAILAGLHAPDDDDRHDPGANPEIAARMRALLQGGRLSPAEGPSPPITADGRLLDAPDGTLRHEVTTEFLGAPDANYKRIVAEGVVAEASEAILIGTFRAADTSLTAIAEILPADPQAARSRLRRRAIGGFLVALGCFLFGVLMALVV
jgi:hypothetical protein